MKEMFAPLARTGSNKNWTAMEWKPLYLMTQVLDFHSALPYLEWSIPFF